MNRRVMMLAVGVLSTGALGGETRYVSVGYGQFEMNGSTTEACSRGFGQNTINFAEVNLPDGAVLTELRIDGTHFWNDVLSTSVSLQRVDVATCGVTPIATITTTDNFTDSFRQALITNHVVDNGTGMYRLRVQVAPLATLTMKRVRIAYSTPPTVAPCDGDINGDQLVDAADLSVLLARFGSVCAP